MNHRFTVDRQSFEQFIAAVSLFQSLQQSAARKGLKESTPLSLHLLETLRAIDSGELSQPAALERVTALALQIVGGDSAALWLFNHDGVLCQTTAGASFADAPLGKALRFKLQSAGAFSDDPPARLDLTRTLENCSAILGSSLGIAILPGGNLAGALAVFSLQSTFTERNYANLRLIAGLAQYVLTKRPAAPELQGAADVSLPANPATISLLEIPAAPRIERSARAPFISREPVPSVPDRPHEKAAPPLVFPEVPLAKVGDVRPHIGTRLRSLLAIPAREAMQLLLRRCETAISAAGENLHRLPTIRNVRLDWQVLRQALPAFAILAVMSFFVGLITGGRHPVTAAPMNATAEAATQPSPLRSASAAVPATSASPSAQRSSAGKSPLGNSASISTQEVPGSLSAKKSAALPTETSHRQITDRETAAAIAELSKFEIRNLHRVADYGDDQAALQLGMLYELGRGFPQSCAKAAQWVTKAAQNGNPAAEYNLGLRYRDGDGVPADLHQAETWLRKAAAQKNAKAKRTLAELASQSAESASR